MFDTFGELQPSPAARRIVRGIYAVFAVVFAVESIGIAANFPKLEDYDTPVPPV